MLNVFLLLVRCGCKTRINLPGFGCSMGSRACQNFGSVTNTCRVYFFEVCRSKSVHKPHCHLYLHKIPKLLKNPHGWCKKKKNSLKPLKTPCTSGFHSDINRCNLPVQLYNTSKDCSPLGGGFLLFVQVHFKIGCTAIHVSDLSAQGQKSAAPHRVLAN